jgi:DNA repair photolyase
MDMIVKEIKAKSCLTKSKLTDYVINPYTGCEHGCKYCYAVFIKRFQDIKEDWGDFVYVKINCIELLEKELKKAKPGNIWLSSVCDCYQPIEEKYKLTRRILEVLSKPEFKDKFTIEILTKSALVQRDFDLINKLGKSVELGMSLGILDDKIAGKIEPFAAKPSERLKTLKEAHKFGIKTYGFISPVMPGLVNLDEVFKKMKEARVEYVWVELLNMRKSTLDRLLPIIRDEFPEKICDFENMIKNYEKYVLEVREKVKCLEKKYDLRVREVVVH